LPALLRPGDSTHGPRAVALSPSTRPWRLRQHALPIAAIALIGSALVLYPIGVVGPPFEKGAPDHSPAYVIRAGILAFAAVALIAWFEGRAGRRPGSELRLQSPSPRRALIYLLLPLAVGAVSIGLLLGDANSFSLHAREDGAVETAQVGMLLAAAGLLAQRSMRGLLRASTIRTSALLAGLGALALLVVVLEEVSWGQRLLDFEAGSAFSLNQQGETNLHNFSTHEFEAAYYSGLFVGLVLLAYLGDRTGLFARSREFVDFVPSTAVLFAAAPMVAFNYGEWNQPVVQLAVFTTVAILAAILVEEVRLRRHSWAVIAPGFALAGVLLIQGALLIEGDAMLRWWQNTEYKELLGTLALLLWAIEVARRPLADGSVVPRSRDLYQVRAGVPGGRG
jgi:hypothetical protein